jgi:hypothetical protein
MTVENWYKNLATHTTLAGKHIGYMINTAVKMLFIVCHEPGILSRSQQRNNHECIKCKIDNLSNTVFFDAFIVALNICTNFITESYRTIQVSHRYDANKMQEMRPSDLARQFLTCPNFAKLCGK